MEQNGICSSYITEDKYLGNGTGTVGVNILGKRYFCLKTTLTSAASLRHRLASCWCRRSPLFPFPLFLLLHDGSVSLFPIYSGPWWLSPSLSLRSRRRIWKLVACLDSLVSRRGLLGWELWVVSAFKVCGRRSGSFLLVSGSST